MITAYIRSTNSLHEAFVDIRSSDGKQLGLYRPFLETNISDVIVLNKNTIVCVGRNNTAVKIAANSGIIIEKYSLPFRTARIIHLPINKLFLFCHDSLLYLVSDQDFSFVAHYDGVRWSGDKGKLVKVSNESSENIELQTKERPNVQRLHLRFLPGSVQERNNGDVIATYYSNDFSNFNTYELDFSTFQRRAEYPSELGQRCGIYHFNFSNNSVVRYEVDYRYHLGIRAPFTSFSPDGEFALRPHLDSFETHSYKKTILNALLNAFRSKGPIAHRDCLWDGKTRFAVKWDLWKVWPPTFVQTITLGWTEADEKISEAILTRTSEILEKSQGKNLKGHLYQFAKNIGKFKNEYDLAKVHEAAWENTLNGRTSSDLHKNRAQFEQKIETVFEADNKALWFKMWGGYRRIGLDGSVSPLIRLEKQDENKHSGNAGTAPWANRYERLPSKIISISRKCDKVLIETKYSVYEFSADLISKLDHIIVVGKKDYTITQKPKTALLGQVEEPLKNSEVLHLKMPIIEIGEFTRINVENAVDWLACEIKENIASIFMNEGSYQYSLELVFKTNSGLIDEAIFIDLLKNQDFSIDDKLSNLIECFLDALPQITDPDFGIPEVWGPYNQEIQNVTCALGPFLNYILTENSDSTDILRKYMLRMKNEHEIFLDEVILPNYFRTHGNSSERAFRLGVFYGFVRCIFGPYGGHSFNEFGTLKECVSSVERSRFCDLFLDELENFIVMSEEEVKQKNFEIRAWIVEGYFPEFDELLKDIKLLGGWDATEITSFADDVQALLKQAQLGARGD